jgi:hypothetical protein
VTEKPSPLASMAAGQIAIQTLLSVLVNLFIGGAEDRDETRREIIDAAEDIIARSAIPDLPAGEQAEAREQAKTLVRGLIGSTRTN